MLTDAGVVICLELGTSDLHMVQLMPLPQSVISCSIKIQIGSTFLVLTYSGCPGKEAVKRMYVCLSCITFAVLYA